MADLGTNVRYIKGIGEVRANALEKLGIVTLGDLISYFPRGLALITGFVEIGETLEDTVRREVMEEVGLRVKDLRYYKNQPWAFTDTLLTGFYCRLDGPDAITLDRSELKEALWMRREELPPQINDISLTAEMIQRFRLGKEKEYV